MTVGRLNYKLGFIKVNPKTIKTDIDKPIIRNPSHRFIVTFEKETLFLHVAETDKHKRFITMFSINQDTIVGGGSVYLDTHNNLVLQDFSGDYGAIPHDIALIFADKLKQELTKKGIITQETAIRVFGELEDFWAEQGLQ